MGGALLVAAVAIASLCFANLNAYSVSALVILLAYAFIGGIDDVMKIRNKKLVAQGKLSKADYQAKADGISARLRLSLYFLFSLLVAVFAYKLIPGLSGHLTMPFVKPEVWFPYLPRWAFILLICLVTTSSANGANFTDGLDSLVSVPIITTSIFAGVVAYISGNAILSRYFLIPHIPGGDELFPICSAIVGSLLAYLWYNSPPAEIYMGDAGSIGFGGAIGMMFVLLKIELFLPIVGVVFLAEALSVLLQIAGFKATKRFSKDKAGRRLFLRAPLHHHFQLKWKERFDSGQALNSKIIWRFHLVSILALIIGSLIFFKVR
jgi:phospho-N-acetylmuramoyl-pentapeptide-transferase